MTARPRLLALRPLGLGDFLTAVPAYRALARAFPGHERVLAAPAPLHVLAPLLGDVFTRALDARPLEPLPDAFTGVDVAVDLHGRGPASQHVLLALRPRRLISFANPAVPETAPGAPFDPGEHEVRRWCRMLTHVGIAADPAELALDVPGVRPAFADATIVHVGAASEARRWPVERFARVARHCERGGERVVLTGDAGERSRATDVARLAGLPPERNLAGTTSLLELAALVAHARRLVAGDTGIAHLASAYAIPSVLLFGPTSPAWWGPPENGRHRVLWAGRMGDPHAGVVDAGLLAIDADDVIAAVDAAFARANA